MYVGLSNGKLIVLDWKRIMKELFNKYAQRLAEYDADQKGLLKIDIGGGLYSREGYKTFGTHIFTIGSDDQTDFLMKKTIQ